MSLPTFGQLTAHCRAPNRTQLSMFPLILFKQSVPFRFLSRSAFDRLAEMSKRLIGNIKLLVFRPAEMALGFAHCFFPRCVAVGLARAGCRHAIANRCLNRDQ